MESRLVPVSHGAAASSTDPARGLAGIVLLALLGLVPVVFWPGVDAFEPHKAALLATGAAILLAASLSRGFASLERVGPGAGLRLAGASAVSSIRADPLGGAVILFLASAALSTVASPRPELGLFGVSSRPAGLVTAIAVAAVFFASRGLAAASPKWLHRVAAAASLAASAAILYALAQLAGADPVDWIWTATFGESARVPGTLGHANSLGAYLAMTLPLLMLLARQARSLGAWVGWVLLGLVSVFVLSMTLSRGAWIGLLAAALTYFLLTGISSRATRAAGAVASGARKVRGRWLRALAGLTLVIAVFLVPLLTPMGPGLLTRIRQVTDVHAPTTESRVLLWRAGLRMLRDHPVLGVGTDSFAAAFPRYRTPESWALEWNSTPAKAHNEVVQIAATQGALGLLGALLVVLLAAAALLRLSRSADPDTRGGAAVAGASLAAWAASSFVGFSVAATGCLAAVLAGWAAGRMRRQRSRGEPVPPRFRPTALSRTAGILAAVGLWIPLVLTPWRATLATSSGLALPPQSSVRVEKLAEATRIAPWSRRYAFELGRTLMIQAFEARDPARSWALLARARRALERALRIAPESAEVRAFRARVLAAQSALRPDLVPQREARAALRSALAADSTGANVLELVTQGCMQLGWNAAARATALRCARLYPDFAPPMLDLGTLALDEDRFGDAVDTLALAIQRRWRDVPESEATARGGLAYAYLRLGRYREAWAESDRALRLDPRLSSARRVQEAAEEAMAAVGRR